jgi:hypothetical protein
MEHLTSGDRERIQKKAKEIAQWAKLHGSNRLKEQLAQGYTGWPLFLHECLAHEMPRACLDVHAEEYAVENDPTEKQLCAARGLANALVCLGLEPSVETAFRNLKVRNRATGDGWYRPCVVYNAYRPGSADAFSTKTIRVDIR